MTIHDFYQREFDRLEKLYRDGWLTDEVFVQMWERLIESVEEVLPCPQDEDTILVDDDE